ncbi:MAG TPA: 4'-phosphopantetheinyl transferase superfamily protein [Parasegetibacter sp.]|jgi:4'-phosphopantetheinyl transferase EntD
MPEFFQHDINEATKVGVWKITEDESFFLSKVPLQRDISHPHKRLQHLAGRCLLPHLFPDFPAGEIAIADTRKPFLEDERYHFSISHCGDYAAAIVSSSNRVGVDIEAITDKVVKLKNKYLTPGEQQLEKSIFSGRKEDSPIWPGIADAREVLFCTLSWSAKEAMFKWFAAGQLDFRRHMQILNINFTDTSSGIISCRFSKRLERDLQVEFRILGSNILAWVIT